MSRELAQAMDGEIDLVPAADLTAEHLEEIEEWTALGWLVLPCGCIARGQDAPFHESPAATDQPWKIDEIDEFLEKRRG